MYNNIFQSERDVRIEKIRQAMSLVDADALLLSTNVNLFYISGRVFSGYVYIPREGSVLYFVKRPVGLIGDEVVYIRKPEQIADYLNETGLSLPSRLLLETDAVSYNETERYISIFGPKEVLNGSDLMRRVRSVKTSYEIELTRQSGLKHTAMYRKIASVYQEGMSDIEFSIELERLARLHGSLGMVRVFGSTMEIFMGSVIAGDNADQPSPYDFAMGGEGLNASLPVGGNGTIIRRGMSVMVDIGGNFTGYMTDLTRTFSVGELSPLAQKAHHTSLKIMRAIEQSARPGTLACDLYNLACAIAEEEGLSAYFMGHRQQVGFIGHGVGIELNETPVFAPRSKDVLAEGMVFALEPKFVIPSVGAVGIENTYLVTADGIENLTSCQEEIVSLDY